MEEGKIYRDIQVFLIGGLTNTKIFFLNTAANCKTTNVSELKVVVLEIDNIFYRVLLRYGGSCNDWFFCWRNEYSDAQGVVYIVEEEYQDMSYREMSRFKKVFEKNKQFEDGGKVPDFILEAFEEEIKNDSRLTNYAEENGFDAILQISKKSGEGVKEAMDIITRKIIKRVEESFGWEKYQEMMKRKKEEKGKKITVQKKNEKKKCYK